MHLLSSTVKKKLVVYLMKGFTDAHLLCHESTTCWATSALDVKLLVVDILSECYCDKIVCKYTFEGLSDVDGVTLV